MRENPSIAREKAELVALSMLPGATFAVLRDMMSLYGSPAGAWDAVRSGRACGASPAGELASWREAALELDPGSRLEAMESSGIYAVVRGEAGYPALLEQARDAPWVLFYRGELPGSERLPVAVVGSRKATPYGLEVARWLAAEMAARGANVISGAAYGVDAAAHRGALEGGGFTTAVLGCGVDIAYPRSNSLLLQRVAGQGCIISEYAPGTPPAKHRFPHRNRIIAWMSRAVVVVEAGEESGALITVEFALGQGRDVMAVPGPVFSQKSRGTNALIKNGASLVSGPGDILEELGLRSTTSIGAAESVVLQRGDPLEERLLAAISRGVSQVGPLSREAGLTVAQTLAALSRMEVGGLAVRGPGGSYHVTMR